MYVVPPKDASDKDAYQSFSPGHLYLGMPRAPQQWIVDQILPTSGLLNIYGPPKEGKTYGALDLAMAISDPARTHFMEWEIKTHGPVFYLQIDTPRGTFHTDYLMPLIDVGHSINGISFADAEMVPYPFNVLGDGKTYLQSELGQVEVPPVAFVVDTLRDAHGGDENDSSVLRNVVTAFVHAMRHQRLLEDGTPVPAPAIVFITHEKKIPKDEVVNLMQGSRGSNYLAGRMDTVMRIANGTIMAQGRSLKLVTLTSYKRNHVGLWVKFEPNVAVVEWLQKTWRNAKTRNEDFATAWGLSVNTADNYFKNFMERGSYDNYPPKKST